MFRLNREDARSLSQESYVAALKLLVDGLHDDAFRSLQVAVKAGKAPTDAYIRLGDLLRERGDVSRAVQIHQSLTVKDNLTRDEKVELFWSLAEDYAALGKSEKSAKTLETAVKTLNIRDSRVFIKIAKHYHVVGDNEKAYEALKEAKKYQGVGDRELAFYLTSVAEQSVEQRDFREAKKVLQRALRHDPDCAPALLLLGDVEQKMDDIDGAISRWRRAAMLSPQLAEATLKKLEKVLFDEGRFGEIEDVYNEVRSVRSGDEAASLAIAAFYEKQGRGEEAIQLLEEYLSVFPESVRARLLLTTLYARYRDSNTLHQLLDEAIAQTRSYKPYVCQVCQFQSKSMRWHCPRCNSFDSFSIDYEI